MAIYYGQVDLKSKEPWVSTPAYSNHYLDSRRLLSWGFSYWRADGACIPDMDDIEASHRACILAINPSDLAAAFPFPAGLEINCVLATPEVRVQGVLELKCILFH
jgi:hypothetical protein